MAINSTLANQLLAATLTGNSYTGPANVYMSLYANTTPTGELSGSGYARQEIAFTMDTGNVRATNTANVVFGNATADWTTARSWAVTDASTSGNVLYSGVLAPTQTLKDTYNLTFIAGTVIINLT